jgi:hypothetical protein
LRVRDDVEPRIGHRRHRVERTEGDELFVRRLERERVEDTMELLRVVSIELRVQEQLPETISWQAGLLDQQLDRRRMRVERLEREKAEDRNGVPMPDPEVESADQRTQLRWGRASTERDGVDSDRLEVVEHRSPRRPAVQLLRDVSLQVLGQACCDGIVRCQGLRAVERRLHQRHHRERDVGARRQVPRAQLPRLRALQQQSPGLSECRESEIKLSPQTRARCRHAFG